MTTFPDEPPPPPSDPQQPAPPVIEPSSLTAAPPAAPGASAYGTAPGAPAYGAATGAPGERLSPWVSIFTRTRATMRQILDEDPRRLVHVLAMLGGMAETLGSHLPEVPPYFTPSLGTVLIVKAILGAIVGLVVLYVAGAAVWMTGRMLGGRGSFVEVRAATAWSNVPALWGVLLLLPLIAYLGTGALNLDPESLFGDPTGLILLVPIGICGVVLFVWRIVIYCKCIGEAHRFSALHGFAAALIALVILAIPIALVAAVALALGGLAALGAAS